MTDSLEARRAALVENLTKLGYFKDEGEHIRDLVAESWVLKSGRVGLLVPFAGETNERWATKLLDETEQIIAPLLAIEAAAFARGVESRQGAGGVGELVRIVDRHLHKSADIACAGSGDVGSPDYCDVCHYWAPMFADLKAAVALRSAPPVQGPDAEAIAAVVDVEAALDEWARKTLRYAMNVGREDFGSPTRAELLDLLRTVTTRED